MAIFEIVGRDEQHRLTASELLGMLEDCDRETSWVVGEITRKMKTEQEVRERLAALQAALKSGHHHTIDTEHRLIAGCRTLRWVLGELKDDWS